MSTAQGMGGLYAFAVITGLGFGMVNYVPVILVGNWFHKHKGVIMGVTVAGTGLGGILSSLVFTNTCPAGQRGGGLQLARLHAHRRGTLRILLSGARPGCWW